ncbi:MAG: Creatininase family protein [Myxococcaceae bacterium]|nr:Creatininase family protein [Myxococcaceae bacterium]
MNDRQRWEEGLAILRARQARLPAAVASAFSAPMALDAAGLALRSARSVVTTGVGSSLAHARYLSWLLRTSATHAIPSWDVPTGSFVSAPGPEAKEQTLVVFSQGLSPNARLPLEHVARYKAVILVTAADGDQPDRAGALENAASAGAIVVRMPCAPEYEVLVRIVGPMIGFVVALRIANAAGAGGDSDVEPESIARAVQDAGARAIATLSTVDPRVFADPITFVGTNGYAALASNLCAKVLEGMFLAWPNAVDALELAHGSVQEAAGKPRTFIALGRGAPHEEPLFARARQTLEAQHRWLQLDARLPEPLAVLEHEAMVNELLLAAIAARRLDQQDWPGKGRDGPLYAIASVKDLAEAPAAKDAGTAPTAAARSTSRRLEDLTWPEIEAHLAAGRRTVVVPLGATEQHGPHMPLAVDAWVAEAIASRFCARIPEALQAPTVCLGCSDEHMAFAGTLSISTPTLIGLVGDVITSLVKHGFDHVVVFSAHGGNDAALAAAESSLRDQASPAALTVVHGIDAIGCLWKEESERAGAPPGAAGHHAGEFETSIIAALRPDAIRWNELRKGISGDVPEPQTLFYPSLRDHAPEGVVGDPSQASADRGEIYLQAWTTFIVDAYRARVDGRRGAGR